MKSKKPIRPIYQTTKEFLSEDQLKIKNYLLKGRGICLSLGDSAEIHCHYNTFLDSNDYYYYIRSERFTDKISEDYIDFDPLYEHILNICEKYKVLDVTIY